MNAGGRFWQERVARQEFNIREISQSHVFASRPHLAALNAQSQTQSEQSR